MSRLGRQFPARSAVHRTIPAFFNANANLAAATSSGATGNFSSSENVTFAAATATGTAAAITPQVSAILSGIGATGGQANFTIQGDTSINLVAAAATGAFGAFTPLVGAILSAATGAPGVGNLTPEIDIAFSAAIATGNVEALLPSIAVALQAVAATGNIGAFSVVIGISVSLIAATASGATGAFTPEVDVPLGAASATASAAGISALIGTFVNLVAAATASSAANFVPEVDFALSAATAIGSAAAFSSVAIGILVNLINVSASGGFGALVPNLSTPTLTGVHATGDIEAFTAQVGAIINAAAALGTPASFGPSIFTNLNFASTVANAANFLTTHDLTIFLAAVEALGAFANFSIQIESAIRPVARYTIRAPHWNYSVVAMARMGMPFFGSLPSIDPEQAQSIAMDFGRFLPTGVVLTGTPTLTISTLFGQDPNAAGVVTEGPAVGTDPYGTNLPGTAILWQVSNPLPGVQYLAVFSCSRSDGDIAAGSTTFWGSTPGRS